MLQIISVSAYFILCYFRIMNMHMDYLLFIVMIKIMKIILLAIVVHTKNYFHFRLGT